MPNIPLPLSAELQGRILWALRANRFDLADFKELREPSSEKLKINYGELSADEITLLFQLARQGISYLAGSGRVHLTKSLKVALLKSCQAGMLIVEEMPELIAARQAFKRDYSTLRLDQLRLLAKLARLHKASH